jgi:hypothetical protein
MLKYKEFKNWLNEAAKKPSKSDVPPIMYEHAKKYNKVDEFASFVDLLPTDAFKGIDLVFNKILSTPNNIKDFFEHLYTYNVIEDIKASDYSHGLSQIIFEAEPKGLGRGELFIAWINSKIKERIEKENEECKVVDISILAASPFACNAIVEKAFCLAYKEQEESY